MMNIRTSYLISAAVLLAPASGSIANDDRDDHTFGFGASLSGAQEVVPPGAPTTPSPGVATRTRGDVQIEFARDLSSFAFRLVVRNGVGVTQAHLHCGRPGENGPIIVFLSALDEQGRDVNGVLAQDTRANADIETGAEACEEMIGRPIRNIASLAGAALDGLVYANVHTIANPAGEVRGQLIADDGDDDFDDDVDDVEDDSR